MYRWIDYVKNDLKEMETIETKRSEPDDRLIPTDRFSNAPLTTNRTNIDPMKVSYLTDSDLSYTLSRSYCVE